VKLRGVKRKIREFLFGFLVLEPVKTLERARFQEECAMMAATLGDMLGIPFAPPIYRLRLLAAWAPLVEAWKREVLREKDVVEKLE